MAIVKMASTLKQCRGVAGKVCKIFLPAVGKDTLIAPITMARLAAKMMNVIIA